MSTTLPPAPPRPPGADRQDELEALIEEARRRARKRRALYGLSGLFAAGAAVAGLWGFQGGGGSARPAPPAKPSAPGSPQQSRPGPTLLAKNGPLAIIAGPSSDRIVVVGPRGRFFRSLRICRAPRCGGLTSVAWSPDGQTLAYGTASGGGASWHPQDGLHLFDLSHNKDRRVDAGYGNWQDLAWSPDGTRLASVSGATIEVIRIAHPERPVLFRDASTSPSWSPDGRQIAYDRCHGGRTSGTRIARSDGSRVRRLTRYGCAPAWSPDGSRIAYTTRCGLRLTTPAGKDVTPNAVWRCLHIGVVGSPTWSPDGRRIAVAGRDGVYVMNGDGSGLAKIWDGPAARPSWRPVLRRRTAGA
jgi:WD40 repeat protein